MGMQEIVAVKVGRSSSSQRDLLDVELGSCCTIFRLVNSRAGTATQQKWEMAADRQTDRQTGRKRGGGRVLSALHAFCLQLLLLLWGGMRSAAATACGFAMSSLAHSLTHSIRESRNTDLIPNSGGCREIQKLSQKYKYKI